MSAVYVLFAACQPDSWSIAKIIGPKTEIIEIPEAIGLETAAEPVWAEFQRLGYEGEAVLLALPSQICLAATIEESGIRGRARSSIRRSLLEEQIPLSIEETVMDFVPGQARSLGVAVALEMLAPLIEKLENAGAAVCSVCPTALLVTDQILHAAAEDQIDGVLCRLHGQLDLIGVEQQSICFWRLMKDDPSALHTALRFRLIHHEKSLVLHGIDLGEAHERVVESHAEIKVVLESSSTLHLASSAAQRIMTGCSAAPIELRKGPLGHHDPLFAIRKPLRAAMCAAVIFLLTVAACFLWRGYRYQELYVAAKARQVEIFRQTLPQQTVPFSIVSRLQSESKRLQGLSGVDDTVPHTESALALLQRTVLGLPRQLRFKLMELRFEPQHLYLEGQTLDHGSADQIAQTVHQATNYQIDPPHTEQPAGEDVTFTISGSALLKPERGGHHP